MVNDSATSKPSAPGKTRVVNYGSSKRPRANAPFSFLLISGTQRLPILPQANTQATGLGRHAPLLYQWAPSGEAILFQGANSLAWYDLKSPVQPCPRLRHARNLADPKILS